MLRSIRSSLVVSLSLAMLFLVVGCGSNQQATNKEASSPSSAQKKTVSPELKQAVQSIRQADEDIDAEKTKNNQRVGIVLTDPTAIYRGKSVTSAADGQSHQLRVILRQQRTKRVIPGVPVEARFLDKAGNTLKRVSLTETWGPYRFYGANTSIPSEASMLAVNVGFSQNGRHAGMKEISTKTFSVEFELARNNNTWKVKGPSPSPAAKDYTLGTDVRIALEEAIAFKTKSPYKIGLIAESAEPFWTVHPHGGKAHLHMAEIPDNANRHMEIVLLDAQTNRIIPQANISMKLTPIKDSGESIRTTLPFLLAAFNHYGNSIHVPLGQYRVTATVKRPDLAHLAKTPFPQSVTAQFDWTNKKEKEGEEHHE